MGKKSALRSFIVSITMIIAFTLPLQSAQKKNALFTLRPEAGENLELFLAGLNGSLITLTCPWSIFYIAMNNYSPSSLSTLINYSAKHNLTKLFKFLYPLHCTLTTKSLPLFAGEKKSAFHYAIENQNLAICNAIIDSWERKNSLWKSELVNTDKKGNTLLHWLADQSKKKPHLMSFITHIMFLFKFSDNPNIVTYFNEQFEFKNNARKLPSELAAPKDALLFSRVISSPGDEKKEEEAFKEPSNEDFLNLLQKLKGIPLTKLQKLVQWYPTYLYKKTQINETLFSVAVENNQFDIVEWLIFKGNCAINTPKNSVLPKPICALITRAHLGTATRACARNYKLIPSAIHQKIKKSYFSDCTFKFA